MALSLSILLPIFKSTKCSPISTKGSLPALLICLLHVKTLGLFTIDLKNLEDITLIPAPVSNKAMTSLLLTLALYKIGLESSVFAPLLWISFASLHSHSESDCSKAWHNLLISSSVSCGVGESVSSPWSKKASPLPIHLLSANLQSLLTIILLISSCLSWHLLLSF